MNGLKRDHTAGFTASLDDCPASGRWQKTTQPPVWPPASPGIDVR